MLRRKVKRSQCTASSVQPGGTGSIQRNFHLCSVHVLFTRNRTCSCLLSSGTGSSGTGRRSGNDTHLLPDVVRASQIDHVLLEHLSAQHGLDLVYFRGSQLHLLKEKQDRCLCCCCWRRPPRTGQEKNIGINFWRR